MRTLRLLATVISIIGWGTVITSAQSPVVSAELIFPLDGAPTPGCHASTIVETRDGRLLAAWFAGTDEGEDDVGIWVSRWDKGAWSKPVEVANGVMSPQKRFPCWNPVLLQPKKGPLVLFFKVGPTPSQWWGEMVTSKDNGKTWQGRRRLPPEVVGPIKDKPVQLRDGRILCPSSSENMGWRIHLEVTKDLENWTVIGPLNDPNKIGVIQPTILQYAGGRLQMLCRTRGTGFISQCWSQDEGRTWSELTATDMPNPNSGIDAVTLQDGRQLLVFNNTPKGRTP
ncbi:MAG: exo-alpha-sialidase, partial [Sedimentisphaerales bacterium]|nr:exo-alpha-sialidase [Sedimentisphaerales bacterium]